MHTLGTLDQCCETWHGDIATEEQLRPIHLIIDSYPHQHQFFDAGLLQV